MHQAHELVLPQFVVCGKLLANESLNPLKWKTCLKENTL